jgi:type VI protein secretion system component Hcp
MAFSGHLKVDGIEGESMDKGYDGQIDVLHYSMGVSNPPSMLGGGR